MTLRQKTMLWTTVLLIISLAVVYELARRIFLEEMTVLGGELARRRAVMAANVISSSLSTLERNAYAWATRDDVYEFAKSGNGNFAKVNLTSKTFFSLRANLIMIVDATGRAVYTRELDYMTGEEIPATEELRSQITRFAMQTASNLSPSIRSGIFDFQDRHYLLAAHPILTDEGRGPCRGAVVLGRQLDHAEQDRLQDIIQQPFALFNIHDPALQQECPDLPDHSRKDVPVFCNLKDSHTINGYALIKDTNGEWGYVVRVEWQRAFYAEGKKIIDYFVWSFLAIGMIIILANLLLLRLMVLNPLSNLASQVQKIGERGELYRRIDPYGGGELYSLARQINQMLDDLQRAQENPRKNGNKAK